MKLPTAFNKSFAKFLLFTLLLTAVGPLEMKWGKASEPEFNTNGIRANTLYVDESFQIDIRLETALQPGTSEESYQKSTTFISEVLVPDFAFDAVGIEWRETRPLGTEIEFFIRFQPKSGPWTEWQLVDLDDDFKGEEMHEFTHDLPEEVSRIIPTQRAQSLQYKIELLSEDSSRTPSLDHLRFHYIDAQQAQSKTGERRLNKTSAETLEVAPLKKLEFAHGEARVISRSEWEADETWRLSRTFGLEEEPEPITGAITEVAQELEQLQDKVGKNGEESILRQTYPEEFELLRTVTKSENNESLYWPQEYAKNIDKIIIHHTASTPSLDNPEASIRAIYYYHAIRRGWGDIGYNYLIDTQGNIYEGRAGGERVVAGHARGYNTGSIGIAVLGNYEEDQVPYPVLDALSRLIQDKATLYNIQVDGFGRFRGDVLANVLGHRDTAHTICPGENLYKALPTLRKLIASNQTNREAKLTNQTSQKPFEFVSVESYSPVQLKPEKTTQVTLKLKNIGQETWNSETYLVADQNPAAEAVVHLVREEGNSVSIGRMAESQVAPGMAATFKVNVEAKLRGGFESFDVTPIFNGNRKTTHYLDLPVYVEGPTLAYKLISNTVSNDRVKAGETVKGKLTVLNTSNVSWVKDGAFAVKLLGEGSALRGHLDQNKVKPGETATFTIDFSAGQTTQIINETLTLWMNDVGKLKGEAISIRYTTYDDKVRARLVAQSEPAVLRPKQQKAMWIELQNTSNRAWTKIGKNKLDVGKTHHPSIKVTKPILTVGRLEPGETSRARFTVTAPEDPGTYTVYLWPRQGSRNLIDDSIKVVFIVMGIGGSPSIASNASAPSSAQNQLENLSTSTPIRIKLGYDPAQFGNPVISANGPFTLELNGSVFKTFEGGDTVEVRKANSQYQILYNTEAWVVSEIPRFVPELGTILEIDNYDKRPAWNIALNDNRFRGALEVQGVDSQLVVINELPLEDYVRGVAEGLNSEPMEKLRTMAILARTYALYYMTKEEKFPGKPYHLSDNPDETQKYLGYGFELRAPNNLKAAQDTRGKIVTYNGELIKTPYFNTSDGTATKSAEQVWGWTHTPYLVSVPDPLCASDQFRGHGVGLSGCGATAAAERGFTHEEIIKYYFTGVEVTAQ